MRRSIHFGGLNETFVLYDRNRFERRRVTLENKETGEVTNVRNPVIPLCTGAQGLNPKAVCSQGDINVTESSANFRYTALHVKVDKRFAERYQFTGSYALSRFTGFNEVIEYDDLFAGDGYLSSDRTHRFAFQCVMEHAELQGRVALSEGAYEHVAGFTDLAVDQQAAAQRQCWRRP